MLEAWGERGWHEGDLRKRVLPTKPGQANEEEGRGRPNEIAAGDVFLTSDASSDIFGHDLVADGRCLTW